MSEHRISVIESLRIFDVRGRAVVLDSDLAAIYGVQTKVFNQAIRRNSERFPPDFLFRLTVKEWAGLSSRIVTLKTSGLRSQIVTSSSHGGRRYAPVVFTEHGAIMAATILAHGLVGRITNLGQAIGQLLQRSVGRQPVRRR